MEALYLLCSVASTFVTSSFLSLSLAIRAIPLFLSRVFCSPAPEAGGGGSSSSENDCDAAVWLYEGRVRHARRRPVAHAFEYPVRYALIDIDRAPQSSHLSAERAREIAHTKGPVFLLTIPANLGYEQNPLSVYYCYEVTKEDIQEGGSTPCLKMCIAEVTNTPWGERVCFIFSPGTDVVTKPLHVSPFMDMLGTWCMFADAPGEDLSLVISVQHPILGNYFTATLRAKRVHSSSDSIFIEKYFWLMPHKVAMWIYWQALKLWWKNVKFLDHPKYLSSRYRDDAVLRNRELLTQSTGQSTNLPHCTSNMDLKDRWCVWREAPWPWS
ncbi:hypothetical protein Cni_G05802 [Canna indica]|uniref:DUF1365 domain-containing protein n=1 Tax=Canna indica TaxID=4628 RepID=A0AAQ3JXJ7_9LILI|nr:hypothetical protein Cni_G05802 [Canna indica]